MSRKSLAEKIGVSTQQLHKYETGISGVSCKRMWAISHAPDTDVEHFFQHSKRPVSSKCPDSPRELLSKSGLALLTAFNAIENTKRQKAMDRHSKARNSVGSVVFGFALDESGCDGTRL